MLLLVYETDDLFAGSRSSLEAFQAPVPLVLPFDNDGTRPDAQVAGRRLRVLAQDQIRSTKQERE